MESVIAVFILIFVATLFFALLPAFIARGKGRSFLQWYIYGVFFSLIACVHAIVIKPNENAPGKALCPQCREVIDAHASVCPFCRAELRSHPTTAPSPSAPLITVGRASQSPAPVSFLAVGPVGTSPQPSQPFPADRSFSSDAYQLYLVSKYQIAKNNTLEKFVVKESLFISIDDALTFADTLDRQAEEAENLEIQRRDEEQRRRREADTQVRARMAAKAAEERKQVEEERARREAEQIQKKRTLTRYAIGVGAIFVVATALILLTHRWEYQTSILDDPNPFEQSRLDEMDRVDKTELPVWLQRARQDATHRRTWSKDTRTLLDKIDQNPNIGDRLCRQPFQAQGYAKKAMANGKSAQDVEAQFQQFLAIYDDGPEYFALLELKGVATAYWVNEKRANTWCADWLVKKLRDLRQSRTIEK